MGVRQWGVVVELESQRVVVMMPLARLMHQSVVDLERQGVGLPRHKGQGQRRQQLQREQSHEEPATKHVEILASTRLTAFALRFRRYAWVTHAHL